MLQTTLSMLETLLQSSQLNKTEVEKFLKVYSHYKVGKWIYPGAMYRMTNISIVKIYGALNILEQKKMVKSYFEIICEECKRTTTQIYESFDNIPQHYFCDNCGHKGNTVDGAILIYKVIRDE